MIILCHNLKPPVQKCESFNVVHKIGQHEIKNSVEIQFGGHIL